MPPGFRMASTMKAVPRLTRFGRRNRDRTCDLCLVRAALSQLSYPPESSTMPNACECYQVLYALSTKSRTIIAEKHRIRSLPNCWRNAQRYGRVGAIYEGTDLNEVASAAPAPHAYRSACWRCSHGPAWPGRIGDRPRGPR